MEKIHDLITVRQAAKISGYNPDYISSLIRSGKIRGKKVGKNWLTTADEVQHYAQALKEQVQFSKLSPQSRMLAHAVAWLQRRFSRSLKTMFLFLAVSAVLALLSYGAYAMIYNQAYSVAQSVSASTSTASTASAINAVDGNITTTNIQ